MSHREEGAGRVSLFVFIDALGWEVLRGRRFLEDELPWRQPVRSVLGYSSACVPSILTGLAPRDHGQWSFFFCSPGTSPFRSLRALRHLPRQITDRARVRGWLSKLIAKLHGFTGYFQLYQLPFEHAHEFDYCEKTDLFAPGGINGSPTIFDRLRERGIPFHMSDWRRDEGHNLDSLKSDLATGNIRFAFVYLPALDGALHEVGKAHPDITRRIAEYESSLRQILDLARRSYGDVRLSVISDHGMADVGREEDLQALLSALPYQFGRDYVVALDSTMARFWFRSDDARAAVAALLADLDWGRNLRADELAVLGCDFDAGRYGELIFLADPGVVITPSHMGRTAPRGMHGYHPNHPDSDAVLLSSHEPALQPSSICSFHDLMVAEACA
jgi:hypothetical protein